MTPDDVKRLMKIESGIRVAIVKHGNSELLKDMSWLVDRVKELEANLKEAATLLAEGIHCVEALEHKAQSAREALESGLPTKGKVIHEIDGDWK